MVPTFCAAISTPLTPLINRLTMQHSWLHRALSTAAKQQQQQQREGVVEEEGVAAAATGRLLRLCFRSSVHWASQKQQAQQTLS